MCHHSDAVHSGNRACSVDCCCRDYLLIWPDGKTMGIIGFGRIGQAEGRVARVLGMDCTVANVKAFLEGNPVDVFNM